MPTPFDATRLELELALIKQRDAIDQTVIQLVAHRFPAVALNPDETIPGRISLNWTGPDGRHLELIVHHAATARLIADLPTSEADDLIDAALGADPDRYSGPLGRVGTLAEALPGLHLVDHEDGGPAEHNMTVRSDSMVALDLNRLTLDGALDALTDFHARQVDRVPAGNNPARH